jgi:hypothetical protein
MAATNNPSYIDWSAVIAGTIVATSISILLGHFGHALGFTYDMLSKSEDKLVNHLIILGVWTLWTQLLASMAGGYTAGRIPRAWGSNDHESEIRDGAHGALVWASSTIIAAVSIAIAGFWASLAAKTDTTVTVGLSEITSHKLGIIWGFSLAAFSVVSAVAAWATATVGGDHRDKNPDVSRHISFRRRVTKKK